MKKEDTQKLIRHHQRIIDLLMMEKLLDVEPTDDKPETKTHRTVTLRIPKDLRVGEVMWRIHQDDDRVSLMFSSDTDLQAAIDKIGERDE